MPKNMFPHDPVEEQIEATIMVTPVERQGGMRLNSVMKAQVIQKALEHAFKAREDALIKEQHALSRLFWLDRFGKAKLAHAKALGPPFTTDGTKDRYGNEAPNGILTRWNVGGQTVDLLCLMPLNINCGLEDGNRNSFCRIMDEKLVERCRIYQDAIVAFQAERQKVDGTLTGMLSNISTYNSLEKNWPQGNKFYKHLPKAFPFRHQVPAVLINELNAALGV